MTLTLAFAVFITASTGQSRDSTPRFKTGIDLVSFDLCVRDASGRFVTGLAAQDFLILENGKPQRASFLVPSSAVPLTAVLMIDVSHSMYGDKLQRALEAARQFAELLGPDDSLAILAFNHRTMPSPSSRPPLGRHCHRRGGRSVTEAARPLPSHPKERLRRGRSFEYMAESGAAGRAGRSRPPAESGRRRTSVCTTTVNERFSSPDSRPGTIGIDPHGPESSSATPLGRQ